MTIGVRDAFVKLIGPNQGSGTVFHYLHAQLSQGLRHRIHHLRNFRRRADDPVIGMHSDSQPLEFNRTRIAEGHWHYSRIDPIDAGNDRQRQRQVLHISGQRADLRKRVQSTHAKGDYVPRPGHPAGVGLDAGNPTNMGGRADASAGVAAHVEWRPARRYDCRCAAAAAAGASAKVVGVVSPPIDKIIRLAGQG